MNFKGCLIVFAAFVYAVSVDAIPLSGSSAQKCGYDSCPKIKDGLVNVHLIPHTHDDVGWLKTVDQYYFGSKTDIQNAGVQYILDSVVDALKKDPSRRFIYVETAFFWKWWIKQHDFVKSAVRKLVNNGQLEFISGGWAMNDEAVTHYQSIIDQMTWGLRKLNETFGECGRPKIGWQIDPFGHSREMASIFAQLGFDGVFLGRIDFQDKQFRFGSQSPEMIWQGSPDNLKKDAEIFTSVMYNNYAPPPGFCFDILCDDEPIIDDKKSPDYNVDKRINQFLEYVKNATKVYKSKNILITMGEDFNYQDANVWFKNMDKLIKYSNQKSNGTNINLMYSTPSCYLKSVNEESKSKNITFITKNDDFFPYASDPNAFWTGYFSSRPAIKRFERLGNNFLQISKQLYALADLGPEDWIDLNLLREGMGVMQHHDAITGTEKEHVASDYSRILTKGLQEGEFLAATALSKLAAKTKKERSNEDFEEPKPEIPFNACFLANISQCELSETNDDFVVTVYNPLSRKVNQIVRLPVVHKGYDVRDEDKNNVSAVLIPIPKAVLNIPGRNSSALYDLVFEASDLPPLGFKSYFVTKTQDDLVLKSSGNVSKFGNKKIAIKIDATTGLIFEISMNGKDLRFTQNFFYYKGAVGDNREFRNRSSGAYIFRPNGTINQIAPKVLQNTIFESAIVSELHQTFSDWVSQTVRVYHFENVVEFDWLVGPVPTDDQFGKEVVTKYTSRLNTDNTFYTDSNGRELLKRVKDFRPTWKLNLEEEVAGNYYPVTSKILVRDSNADVEMAVLVDRAQGGSSLQNGEIELMVHRRCLHDDAFGVGEALNETAFGKGLVVRGSHYLVMGPYINEKGLAAYERDLAQRKLLQAWTFVSPNMGLTFDQYKAKYLMNYSGLKRELPQNVQILTLEPWKGMDFLLRLEHIFETGEDPTLSKPVTINIKDLFAPFKIKSFHETTLGANQWIKDKRQLHFAKASITREEFIDYYTSYNKYRPKVEEKWKVGNRIYKNDQEESNDIYTNYVRRTSKDLNMSLGDEFNVTLNPMQIKTFVIEISI